MSPRDAHEQAGVGTAGYRNLCHTLLTLAFVLSAYDRHVLAVLVDPIKADLGLSDSQMGLLQGFAFAICYAVAALPVAWAVDRGGRVRIASGCIALWSAGTAICGLASSFATLLAGRTVTAISEAGYSPAALSVISDTFSRKDVPRASALYLIAPSLGLGAAMMGGGALLHYFDASGGVVLPLVGELKSWQSVLAVSALPGFVMAALQLVLLREPPRDERLVAPGGFGEAEEVTFSAVMQMHGRFLIPYIGGCTAILLVMFTLAAWSASVFSRSYDISPAAAASLIGPAVLLGGIAGPITASFLLGRCDGTTVLRRMVRIVLITGLAASILVPAMVFSPRTMAALLLGLTIFCVSMVAPMIVAPIQILVPSSLRARFHAGASFLFTIVAGGVGPAIVGFIVDYGLGDERLLGIALAITCTTSAVAGLLLIMHARAGLR